MLQYKDLKKILKQDNSGLPSVKVALVGDTATQFLATAIQGMGVEHGYHIDLFEAEYNQVERQFLSQYSFRRATVSFSRRTFVFCGINL